MTRMPTTSTRARESLIGAVFLLVIALVVAVAIGRYANVFTRTAPVSLTTDRIGLNLLPGAKVKFQGVPVGTVGSVDLRADSAVLRLRMDPAELAIIPANVTAVIVPTTVFGAKYVDLSPPAHPSPVALAAGAMLDNRGVTAEVNTVFDQLTRVLDAVSPAKLNVTLAALAGSLQGRGDELGGTLTQLNGYLVQLNPSVPALRHDFAAAAGVGQLYADVTPDLVGLLDNLAVTGDTLVDRRDDLHRLLPELADAAHSGHHVFDESSDDLPESLDLLRTTTGLLSDYSPGLTCFIEGLDNARKLLEPVIGGKYPALNLNVGFLPGAPPYQPGKDLPKVGAANPPACHGLPMLGAHQVPAPYVQTDVGSHVNPYRDNHLEPGDPPVVVQLFGPELFRPRSPGSGAPQLTGGH